jgi:hypothetical protein
MTISVDALLAVELSFEKGHFIERRFILVAIVA